MPGICQLELICMKLVLRLHRNHDGGFIFAGRRFGPGNVDAPMPTSDPDSIPCLLPLPSEDTYTIHSLFHATVNNEAPIRLDNHLGRSTNNYVPTILWQPSALSHSTNSCQSVNYLIIQELMSSMEVSTPYRLFTASSRQIATLQVRIRRWRCNSC